MRHHTLLATPPIDSCDHTHAKQTLTAIAYQQYRTRAHQRTLNTRNRWQQRALRATTSHIALSSSA
jgi:hypothetical protein